MTSDLPGPETPTDRAPDVAELLGELTTDERVLLLGGRDQWHTQPIARLGLPSLHLSDGPVGVRGARTVHTTSVSFPCGAAIGATFDPHAAAELADALADECYDKGVHVLLGPTVNLQRHPLGGRHFECYSEDPVLTADLAVAYVRALQARGIAATVKHFVANDTEFERHTISSEVADDVLRRLYLFPFEDVVCRAKPYALMTSYNKVNGVYAAEHRYLLDEVLRGEWGYDGLVMSDWYGAKSTVASACAGLDLEMPGPPIHYGKRLAEAVESGEVSEEVLAKRARCVLELVARARAPKDGSTSRGSSRRTLDERRALSRDLAARSFVLLENRPVRSGSGSRSILPLELAAGSRLAVVGPNATHTAGQGGGSAQVNPEHTVSIAEALRARYEPAGVEVETGLGCENWEVAPALDVPVRLEYRALRDGPVLHEESTPRFPLFWIGDPVPGVGELTTDGFHVRASCRLPVEAGAGGEHRLVLSQVGSASLRVDGSIVVESDGERTGRRFAKLGSVDASGVVDLDGDRTYELVVDYATQPGLPIAGLFVGRAPPGNDDEQIARAVELARRADVVVCALGTSAEWESEGYDRASMGLPGRQDDLVAAVVAANPATVVVLNTGSPVDMDWADEPAAILQAWFGGEETGAAVADVLSGASEPGGRLPHCVPVRIEDTPAFPCYPGSDGRMEYGEGLLVGHRHYATCAVEPRYWFGHGLGYTTVELGDHQLTTSEAGDCSVRTTLTNTGQRPGSGVAQVYLRPAGGASPSPGEPFLQFAGSGRCTLAPGESATVTVTIDADRLARLVPLPGRYDVLVGTSAGRLTAKAGEITREG